MTMYYLYNNKFLKPLKKMKLGGQLRQTTKDPEKSRGEDPPMLQVPITAELTAYWPHSCRSDWLLRVPMAHLCNTNKAFVLTWDFSLKKK